MEPLEQPQDIHSPAPRGNGLRQILARLIKTLPGITTVLILFMLTIRWLFMMLWRLLKFFANMPNATNESMKSVLGTVWLILTIVIVGVANTFVLDTWNRLGLTNEATQQSQLASGFIIAVQILPAGILAGSSLVEIVRGLLGTINAGWLRSAIAPMIALVYLIAIVALNTHLLPMLAYSYLIPRVQAALNMRDLVSAEFYADLAIKFSSFNAANVPYANAEVGGQANIDIVSRFSAAIQTSGYLDVMVEEDDTLVPARQWPTIARFDIARLHETQPEPDLERIQNIYTTLLRVDGCWLAAAWQYGELVNYYHKTQQAGDDGVLELQSALMGLNNAILLIDTPGLYVTSKCEERYPLVLVPNNQIDPLSYWLHMTRGETLMLLEDYSAAYEDFDRAIHVSIGAQIPLHIIERNLIVKSDASYANPILLETQIASREVHRAFIRRVEVAKEIGDSDLITQSQQQLCNWIHISGNNIPIWSWSSYDMVAFYELELPNFDRSKNDCSR